MTKKFIVVLLAIFLLLSTSYVFAANNELGDSANKTSNTVRNVVGGAENVVEDTAKDATGAVRTGINTVGNATENTVNDMNRDTNAGNMNTRTNDSYTATRTSADAATRWFCR